MAVEYPMMHETVWFDQPKVEKAEAQYQEHLAQTKYGVGNSPAASHSQGTSSSNLVNEIARARQHIQSSLNTTTSTAANVDQANRIEKLEKENKDLRKMVDGLCTRIKKLEVQMGSMGKTAPAAEEGSPESDESFELIEKDEAKSAPAKPAPSDDDDDDDLFGSDDDDEEMEKLAEERRQASEAKKEASKKKAGPVGKSLVTFAIKGWGDETDLEQVERDVRAIERQGLRWGAESKFEPVAFGVKMLVIGAVVIDEECSTTELEEFISEFEDVQSVDILGFNKL